MSKLIPLSDAITKYVNGGDTVYTAGFTHLIPFAAGTKSSVNTNGTSCWRAQHRI